MKNKKFNFEKAISFIIFAYFFDFIFSTYYMGISFGI